MHHISQVSGQQLKLIDNYCWGLSPHGCITYNVARVIHHSILLLFIQVGHGIPGQGFRGQVQWWIVLTVEFIDSHSPYIKQQCHPPQS